jgi:hypothetical protein
VRELCGPDGTGRSKAVTSGAVSSEHCESQVSARRTGVTRLSIQGAGANLGHLPQSDWGSGERLGQPPSLRAGSGTCSDITAFCGVSVLNLLMPTGLRRFQQSGQSHFVTFTCYHRRAYFDLPDVCDLFVQCLESMRCRFAMCVYGYVVMPEHVHLLLNEPEQAMLADAIHLLKIVVCEARAWAGRFTLRRFLAEAIPRSERQG